MESFVCEFCSQKFPSFLEKEEHRLDVHILPSFLCKICQRPIYNYQVKDHRCYWIMENFCSYHEINFETKSEYDYHTNNECKEMLKSANMCIHHLGGGKCCKKAFKHVSSLILHYHRKHKIYACVHCYQTFSSRLELEEHEHIDGMNL